MKIVEKYSHLNGEEYLIVHYSELYEEIKEVITSIDCLALKKKVSKEKTVRGKKLFSPKEINREFKNRFIPRGWKDTRYNYYVTTDRKSMEDIIDLEPSQQKTYLIEHGTESPIFSYKQTDFVKNKIAIEVQFWEYAFVAFDLFVKHMLFYTGGVIDLGIEILPMKSLQTQMSSGIAYYEGEVYNVMRQGRSTPAVPLLILGITP